MYGFKDTIDDWLEMILGSPKLAHDVVPFLERDIEILGYQYTQINDGCIITVRNGNSTGPQYHTRRIFFIIFLLKGKVERGITEKVLK